MATLTEDILISQGFEYDREWNAYTKIIGGKMIRCFQHHNTAGYWVCDIWTTYDPVQNKRITTDNDLQEFIEATCPDQIIRIAVSPYDENYF